MKHLSVLLFLFAYVNSAFTQNKWSGHYEGLLNGEKVTLTLQTAGTNQLTGNMKDSENNYSVRGSFVGNKFNGKATEINLGIVFEVESVMNGSNLSTSLAIDVLGTVQRLNVDFVKKESINSTLSNNNLKNPVSNKSRDSRIIGAWSKETNYSSGYGSNGSYGSMNMVEKMEFLSDGRISNGGNNTTVGGSNYFGQSSEQGGNLIEGIYWYTEGNKIFLYLNDKNQAQTVELGSYYLENRHLLITGINGEKLLLSKN